MSFVTVFMTVTTAFVLLAPLAMAAVLMAGGVPIRPSIETVEEPVPATGAADLPQAA